MTLRIANNFAEKTADNLLTIAMAADAGYILPTLVAIDSILANTAPNREIDLRLITPPEDKQIFESPLSQILSHYQSGSFHLLSGDSAFENATLHIPHITTVTYYRLALPELLPDVERCLYLDGDIIACDDLSAVIDSLTDSDLVCGVKAPAYYWPESNKEANRKRLDLPEFIDYLNAGVLAMNLRLMRELDCSSTFKALLRFGYASQDQDIINKACYGRTRSLHPRFNLMTKYQPESEDSFSENPCLAECYSEEEWQEARQNPVIIHYADKSKPWQTTHMDFANLWWHAASNAADHCDMVKAMLPLLRRAATIHEESTLVVQVKSKECESLVSELQQERELANGLLVECDRLTAERNELKSLRDKLTSELNGLARKRDKLQANLTKCREKNANLKAKLGSSRTQLELANETIRRIYASRSWKIGHAFTSPVRQMKRLCKRLLSTKSK